MKSKIQPGTKGLGLALLLAGLGLLVRALQFAALDQDMATSAPRAIPAQAVYASTR